MLWQGIYYFNKKTKAHCISRTAPFCQSIYRSQYDNELPVIIVKESARNLTENNFDALSFVEINKDKIVKLDWQNWHSLKREAEKLIEGIDKLRTDQAKNKRRTKIEFLLNQANEIYPLNPEKWMNGFWK